jgi:APA family basic amino acid/polyamine antiporter
VNALFRRRPVDPDPHRDTGLHRALSAFDLTFLGVGSIIGAGIFVLTGIAAATKAGPAVTLSFVVAGVACAFTALAYAELAGMLGGSGSAYSYSYTGLGELAAWMIGWNLLLEYGVAVSAVAVAWSGYVGNVLNAAGIALPERLMRAPNEGGVVNLPALAIIVALGILLIVGVKDSARFNNAIAFIKLTAIAIFLVAAFPHVDPANWTPFTPFGWTGVISGASLIFFAYIGFDAVSTAGEEARNPARDMPIAILASLAVCTLIYILVSLFLTGIAPYQTLNVASPVAQALLNVGVRWGGAVVAAGAIAGLTSVMLVQYYGQTRIFLAMSRDGLLPAAFSEVHPGRRTPVKSIVMLGVFIAVAAGFLPLSLLAELVNIGTLAAFFAVCAGVLVLRRTHPDTPRPFRAPGGAVMPVLGMLSCLGLMAFLPLATWIRFVGWLAVGFLIYFSYSRHRSVLSRSAVA